MKKTYRCLAVFLCIAAVILSSCGTGGSTPQSSTGSEPSSEKSEAPAAAAVDFEYTADADGRLTLTAYTGTETDPVIPAEIDGQPVVSIGNGCFTGLLCIRKIHIPEGIESIGDYAFECCSALEKVYFPESLKSIGTGAFSGCSHLTLADMQDGITSIGTGAFLYCTSLVNLELPADLEALGSFAFAGCENIARVNFRGDALTAIPDRLFYGCAGMMYCNLPVKLASVGKRAFAGCEELKKLWFFEPLEKVSEYAFEDCVSLKNLNLPVEYMEKGTFTRCHALSYFSCDDRTVRIGEMAFSGSGIKDVSVAAGTSDIAEGAFGNSFVKSVSVPEENEYYEVKDGSLYADGGKTLLAYFPEDPYAEEEQTAFTVPEGVEVIAAYAFSNSPLEVINLPETLKEIHAYAFSNTRITGLDIPENTRLDPDALKQTALDEEASDPGQAAAEEMPRPSYIGSAAPDKSLFHEEEYGDYLEISNDEFEAWSEKYLDYNRQYGIIDREYMPYIMMYKGETITHYVAMTAVQNHDPDMWDLAAGKFGDDFEEMYLMMNHGLFTELRRGKMCDSLVLYSGLYDSQVCAAAGTETLPTTEQLVRAIGSTFTDPVMISTTTDKEVAAGFGDTLFIIYASKEAMESLGAVAIDSLIGTMEKEILMCAYAQYRILDVGTMEITPSDGSSPLYRNYIKVELLGPGRED